MAEESVQAADAAVQQAFKHVEHYTTKIQAFEDSPNFRRDDDQYNAWKESLEKARAYHLSLTQGAPPAFNQSRHPFFSRVETANEKQGTNTLTYLSIKATAVMTRIRDTNCDSIFDIETVLKLPFPSLLRAPNRFDVTDGVFEYQARSELKRLYDKMVEFWTEGLGDTVKVAGTIGYGKSHMLAVLVLLLLKNRPKDVFDHSPFICYVPDCKELLRGESEVVTILQKNIILNIPAFTGPLDTIQAIREAMSGQRVILVADQWNSIDIDNEQCKNAKTWLDQCLGTSVLVKIHGVSMNSSTWSKLSNKQTSEDRNTYYGGFNDDEFQVWLRCHQPIFTKEKEELERLTGKVPLLLSVFARAYDDSASWEQILQRAEDDSIVRDWKGMLQAYYAKIDGDQLWKVFTQTASLTWDSSILDPRFFYEDSILRVSATSEIVSRLLYRIWTNKAAKNALLTRWRDLFATPQNPSSLGFYVEEIIKAQICSCGVVGIYPLPTNKTIQKLSFKRGNEKIALEMATRAITRHSCWILLDPEMFNYPGVDMILVTETATIGINVTIAKAHSLLEPFFKAWRPLAELCNMSIRGLIVAPKGFHHVEKNVDVALLENVYNELWEEINSEKQWPIITDHTCQCTTGCGTGHCGCRRREKLCTSKCRCVACNNSTLPSSGATATIEGIPKKIGARVQRTQEPSAKRIKPGKN